MKPRHILVIRLSAMGDVAMTIPVLSQLLQQNPDLRLTVLTQSFLLPLFDRLPRTAVYAMEKKGRHRGMRGLFKLSGELIKNNQFDAVADLHNVLRSRILSALFRMRGIPTGIIDKGRPEKKKLTRQKNKKFVPLKTSFQRYADVFNELGIPVALNHSLPVYEKRALPAKANTFFAEGKKAIGIAPFAKHREKTYPQVHMQTVIREISATVDWQVFLLGGGRDEETKLEEWIREMPGVTSLAGKFSLEEELAIISHFDAMISMDSANMHLASLFGVPVISIWGATHPYAGFYGWGQDADNAVQIDLYCRPCSVFGNKPCYRGDHACMVNLPPEKIIDRLYRLFPAKQG
jgi:ADP-heptose:LPS heptosyltransferase